MRSWVKAGVLCVLLTTARGAAAQDVCGDGVRQGDEECDGGDLSALSCELLGFDGGDLTCAGCVFVTDDCYRCGDGERNPTEACDTDDLGDATCETEGFIGGRLTCGVACTISTQLCHTCGNGIVDEGEDCDGDAPGGLACLDFGFDGGTLGCDETCVADTSDCSDDLCGDGFADPGEDCDGDDLKDQTCEGLGYEGGTLGCTRACTFGVEDCEGVIDRLCGNGAVEVGEECDGDNLGDMTCVSLGFAEGELACDTSCAFDLFWCSGGGDVGRPDTGSGDEDVTLPFDETDTGSSPTPEITPITIGCCGVEGGEPVEPDPAGLSLGLLVLGYLVRRRDDR